MDLTKLSDNDLKALSEGNIEAMSTEGLRMLSAGQKQPESTVSRVLQAIRPEPFTEAVARGMFEDPALAVAQLATEPFGGSQALRQYVQEREQRMQELPLTGRLAGVALSPATAMLATRVPQAVSAIPAVGQSRILQSAATGAAAAGLTPATSEDQFAREKATQAATGAVLGPVVDVLAGPLARLGTPSARPELETLQRAGVDVTRLTPGQQLGGVAKRAEESIKSVPIAGELVRRAEQRGFEEFNRGLVDNVIKQVNPQATLPKAVSTRGAIEFAGKELSKAYSRALAPIKITPSAQMYMDISDVVVRYGNQLGEENAALLNKLVMNRVTDLIPENKVLAGGTAKRIDSDLGALERKYSKSMTAQEQTIGEALGEIKQIIRQEIASQDPSGKVRQLNGVFSDFLRLEKAAAGSRVPGGIFSPEQLVSATRTLDETRRKGGFARGQARMQQVAEAGREVLGTRVPDSGTPERIGTTLALLGLGGAGLGAYEPSLSPYIIPGLLTAAAYTRPGLATIRQAGMAGPGLRAIGPVLTPQLAPTTE
jgi:hypothetical protein